MAAKQSSSADAWAQKLGSDDQALQQLLAAVQELNKNAKTGESGDGVASDGKQTVVYGTPSEQTTQQILDHADKYAAAAAALIQQWMEEYANKEYSEDTGTTGNTGGSSSSSSGGSDTGSSGGSSNNSGGSSTGDYGGAVSDWWNTWGSYIPREALGNNAQLANYLKESSQAGQMLRSQLGDKALTRDGLTSFLTQNKDRFPLLSKEAGRVKPGERSPSPFGPGNKGPMTKTSPLTKSVGKSPLGGGVMRKPPTQPQQMARAQLAHQAGWGGKPQMGSPRIPMAGGPRMGGPRMGGPRMGGPGPKVGGPGPKIGGAPGKK